MYPEVRVLLMQEMRGEELVEFQQVKKYELHSEEVCGVEKQHNQRFMEKINLAAMN